MITKTCTRCGETKPLDGFSRDGRLDPDNPIHYGRRARCYDCIREYQKAHYQELRKDPEFLVRRAEHSARVNKIYKLKKYGITQEQYDQMLVEQNFCCGICQRPRSDFRRDFAVDHCHDTDVVRGLLCISCNRGLGYLGDDILRLQMAIKYLMEAGER